MRFHSDGPSIPDILLQRCDAGRVVFLCGAGVSLPSGMPTFVGLTQHVVEFFDPPADSEIMAAFRPWLDDASAANVPLDQIFNLLHLEYGKDEVNALVTERLSAPLEKKDFGHEHALLKRISSSQSGVPQIVTTNFDRLFEAGKEDKHFDLHVPPAFPDLNYGSAIEGVTYLHGRLVEAASSSHAYVLSSADFGRAYLSEGWATNFIRHLLERYTVVLVGYQAEDPPIKYLLQGLNHDGKYDRSKIYAFDRGLPEEIEAKWRDRGVTAIAYSNHSDLWKSMESWAARADDPRRWRSTIISTCQQDPKFMAPYERGQVAHVLRTVQGAKLFAEADPTCHPEWVCVLDVNVRSAKKTQGYRDSAEVFDPSAAYGLDDDLRDISDENRQQGVRNDNILEWRDADDSPHDGHRLGGTFATVPKRLTHLIAWICKSLNSPVLAWWAIRQSELHPRLLQQFEWHVAHSTVLDGRALHILNLILEHHRDHRTRPWNNDWFDLKNRVGAEGWTSSVLREFRRVAAPRLEIKPPYGLGQSRPPSAPWEKIQFGELGRFDVVFLEQHNDPLEVPDAVLSQVVAVLQESLTIGSGLLKDLETDYYDTPTCYPGREVEGRDKITKSAEIVAWFVHLFDRMSSKWPELAHAHVTTWPESDHFFFRKLRLYAFSNANAFEAEYVAKELLSLSQDAFWDMKVARELLFLVVDRWVEFSPMSRNQLTDRILNGPDQRPYWSDEKFPHRRDELVARYGRYLELQKCDMADDRRERIAEVISRIPEWSDGWAISTVTERGSSGGLIDMDDKPDALLNLPVTEVVVRARQDFIRDFNSLTEKRPFIGLVKAYPRKALSALTVIGKNGEYPAEFWSSMITNFPPDIAPRLRTVFLNRVARLPHVVIAELGHTLCTWLEKNLVGILEFNVDLGWKLYDRIVDGLLAAGGGAVESGIVEIRHGGNVIQRSRRTFDHAVNGPVGMCVAALFHAVPGERQEAGSLIPNHIKSRFERLLSAPGEGADHAVSVASSKLNWLMFVDPAWTAERLVPMLAFNHPASEPAWNGFLYSGGAPMPSLVAIIRPELLHLFPWIEQFSWDPNLLDIAGQWLGVLRISPEYKQASFSQAEMRAVLRAMSDEMRNRFILWMGLVGQQTENGWAEHIIPLVTETWPRERRYRTSASMRAWIALLDDTGEGFPSVYNAVKKFLVPVETNERPFYRFTRVLHDKQPIAVLFPETTLDLMERATPKVLTRQPYELPEILVLIAEAEPALISDPRYLRLIDLVERS